MSGLQVWPGLAWLDQLAVDDRVATELAEGPRLTWPELVARSRRVAAGLVERGIGPRQRVAVCFAEEDWCDFVVASFAVWLAGAELLPVAQHWPGPRRRQVLHAAAPHWRLSSRARRSAAEEPASAADASAAAADASAAAADASAADADGDEAGWAGTGWADEDPRILLTRAENRSPDVEGDRVLPGADDLCQVLVTSGSSGSPQLVGATYGEIWPADDQPEPIAPGTDHLLWSLIAIGSSATQNLVTSLGNGVPLLVPGRFAAERDAAQLADRKVTMISVVPSVARLLVQQIDRLGLEVGAVRSVVCSSEPLPAQLFDRLAATFAGARVMNAFAMSEGVFLVNRHGAGPTESIGRADDDTEVRIVTADGQTADPGEVGEIWLRRRSGPPRVLLGRRPSGTRIGADGWVATADLGWQDDDGYVFFAGRRDEIAVIGGTNVSPYVAERALARHPGVAEVAVVGRADPVLGQRLVAVVVPLTRLSPTELHRWCADLLPRAERPSTVELRTSLPRLPGGKVDRRALADRTPPPAPAPASDLLTAAREAWRTVLGGAPPRDDDDLTMVGSFSLLATDVAGRLSSATGLQITPGLVVGEPSISALGTELGRRSAAGELVSTMVVRRADRSGRPPARG